MLFLRSNLSLEAMHKTESMIASIGHGCSIIQYGLGWIAITAGWSGHEPVHEHGGCLPGHGF